MALPALRRLAQAGPLVVAAPPWGASLYRELGVSVVDRARFSEVAAGSGLAVLFKPSFRAAWQARGPAAAWACPLTTAACS